jgi:hypothetical protein
MKRGYKILIGLALVGALYFAYRQVKKKIFLLKGDDLANNNIYVDYVNDDIVFTDVDNNEVGEYQSTGRNMEFPMYNTGSPYTAYDNVAILQTYLVYANPDLDLAIDGMYGDETEAAVMSEVTDIGAWGYEGDDYDFSEVTQEYYENVVLRDFNLLLSE